MRIFLNRNKVATVDPVDFEAVNEYTWTARSIRGKICAAVKTETGKYIYLHRFIAERAGWNVANKFVRNLDGDQLNCCRNNISATGDNMCACPENQAEWAAYQASLAK
jgi:hypothetical protein